MRTAFVVIGFALLLSVPTHLRAEDPAADALAESPTAASRLIDRFRLDWDEIEQARGLTHSAPWIERREKFLAEWLPRTDVTQGDGMEADGANLLDKALLRNEILARRDDLALERRRRDESLRLLPFAPDLAALEDGRRRLENPAPKDAASRLDAARKAIDDLRGKVERGAGKKAEEATADVLVTTPVIAARCAHQIEALKGALRTWFADRDGFEPEFGWWCRKPWEALQGSMDAYAALLRDKIAGGGDALIGDPIGAEALTAALGHEFIPYTPDEVLAIADRQYAWCEAEAKKAAAEMGFGDDWRKALAKVKEDTVEPGRQAALVKAQSEEAIAFVTDRDLVTVPDLCREVWRLHMIPADQQRTMPYAYYSGQSMGVAYPADGMEHDRKLQSMRGNNVHFSRIVTPHELIPGHHLQLFMAARHRPYRELFRTPFFVEGWALYWEMRLWDLGWAKSPQDRLGMLFWRMHRCARITVTLKFHLGQMTPQQMIDHLVEKVGHERDGATAEVRRYVGGGYGPLYQAAYMLGGLQLRALHDELVVKGDGGRKWTEKEFHDAVLREGSIPVRMVRAALRNERIDPAAPAPWRFAD